MRSLTCAILIAFGAPALAAAQGQLEVRGRGTAAYDALLREFATRDDLRVITHDTLLARTDTLRGTVVIADATARIEGTIAGDLVVIDANVFLRPSGQVLGRVYNIAGGFYPSELASITAGLEDAPNAPYDVERRGDTVRVIGTETSSLLDLDGIFGLHAPTYDRVDGVALTWGARYHLPRLGRAEPALHAWVDYRSQRGAFTGGAELDVLRGRTTVRAGVDRTTLSNDRWIRSDINNSISYLVQGRDTRNYYAADRLYFAVDRIVERQARTTTVGLRAQYEDASSLGAGEPWSIFQDSLRSNPAIDDGVILSLTAGAEVLWTHATVLGGFNVAAEYAGAVGNTESHDFARYQIAGEWAMLAFRNHTFEVDAHFRGPLPGTRSLPRQRWTFVGGSGTLRTFDIAQFPGDRLAIVESVYSIPMPARFRLRILGRPALELLHTVGMAWTADVHRDFAQNVGLRLQYNLAYLRVVTNPERFNDDVKFSIGLNFPQGAYPWQRQE